MKSDVLPPQIQPYLSTVGFNTVEYDCPLCGHDGHKEVEGWGTETITHKESAQEAKA